MRTVFTPDETITGNFIVSVFDGPAFDWQTRYVSVTEEAVSDCAVDMLAFVEQQLEV